MNNISRHSQLAKNTMILTFGKICTQFVSFFLLPLYTSILDPSDYGIVDLISTYAFLILPIISLQTDMGVFRFLLDAREDEKKSNTMISTVITVNTVQMFGFILIFSVLHFLIESQYKMFLALEVCLNLYTGTLMQIARGKGKNEIYTISSFISATSSVVMNVIFLAVLRMGVLGMFIGLIISKIITLIYLVFTLKLWKYYKICNFDKELLKEITKYSIPLVPNQLAWWAVGSSDRLVITHVLGMAQNGIFAIAGKFSSMYIAFYNIFNLAWTENSALYVNDKDRDQYLSSVISTMFSLFSMVCIGIIAVMPFVFPIIINEKYIDAYPQIPILMCAVLCQSVVGLISVIYTAKKKSVVLAKTSFWIALINIVTDIGLVKFIGLYAASLSTFIAYAAMMLYRFYDVKKYANIKIPRRKLILTTLLAISVCIGYYLNIKFLQILMLLLTIIIAVVENSVFIITSIKMILNKVKILKES